MRIEKTNNNLSSSPWITFPINSLRISVKHAHKLGFLICEKVQDNFDSLHNAQFPLCKVSCEASAQVHSKRGKPITCLAQLSLFSLFSRWKALVSPIFRVDVCGIRKKRSDLPRRPHPDPKPISIYHQELQLHSLVKANGGVWMISMHFNENGYLCTGQDSGSSGGSFRANHIGYGEFYEHRIRDKIIGSDQLANESKLKKFKLRLVVVTRTIQSNILLGWKE
ncbi:hypothetical protein Ancab_030099 [Ancistrocladus abbreviatus]